LANPWVDSWRRRGRRFADATVAAALPGGLSLAPILARVEGYLFPHEAVFLYWLARSAPGTGAIVEIGSYRGRSTLCLASGASARRRTRIAAVDPHVYETEAEFRENLRRFGMTGAVEVVVVPSVDAARSWREPVRVLFVDGNHERSSVEADVDAWFPHLEPGGFLVLHDSTELSRFPGPVEVARARLRVGPEFEATGQLGSITWARRTGGSDPWRPPMHGRRVLDGWIRALKSRRSKKLGP
jgi:predicted O-methyltransferase YrrM